MGKNVENDMEPLSRLYRVLGKCDVAQFGNTEA